MEEQERKIESLRTRLQSERSISKIARKKADQLAQRVIELETRLEIALDQRKKAEKAAAKVLSILRDNGLEYSDEGASGNGQEEIWNSPREGILSYSETTPEQISGEENYVELFPKDADLSSPVEEGSECDPGTNATGCEADEGTDGEMKLEACCQSKEEVREKEVEGADLSGSVVAKPARPFAQAGKATGTHELLEMEHTFPRIKSPSESYEAHRDESASGVSQGVLRPQADTTRTEAASSSRLAAGKSLSDALVEANIGKENGRGIPMDRLGSGSTTGNRSADHSRAERGSCPVHEQEASAAAGVKGKQSAASSSGTSNSSKFRTISRESSDSRLLLRSAASRGSISSSSLDEAERVLESLRSAKFSIRSGVDKSSSCEGATTPKQDGDRCKRTEASMELPFISSTGLFRVPPPVHGAGTRNDSLLPYSDLVTVPAQGDQHGHHLRASRSSTKMQ